MSIVSTEVRRKRILQVWCDAPSLVVREALETLYTCDDCTDASDCEYAHDAYNTSGDCLANK